MAFSTESNYDPIKNVRENIKLIFNSTQKTAIGMTTDIFETQIMRPMSDRCPCIGLKVDIAEDNVDDEGIPRVYTISFSLTLHIFVFNRNIYSVEKDAMDFADKVASVMRNNYQCNGYLIDLRSIRVEQLANRWEEIGEVEVTIDGVSDSASVPENTAIWVYGS